MSVDCLSETSANALITRLQGTTMMKTSRATPKVITVAPSTTRVTTALVAVTLRDQLWQIPQRRLSKRLLGVYMQKDPAWIRDTL